MTIKKTAVLGNGVMATDIAGQIAVSGYEVTICGRNLEHVLACKGRIEKFYSKQVSKGRLSADAMQKALSNIYTTDRLADIADVDMVIEAIAEDPDVKRSYFEQMDALCREDAILASNTSSLSITDLAQGLKHCDKIMGVHFFHPVSAMKLCEMIETKYVTEDTFSKVKEFCESIGRITVRLRNDSPGFIVNRVLFAYFLECIHIYEEGLASKEDIDLALRYGLNHPLGPFALMDMGGLDTFPAVCKSLQDIDEKRFECPESIEKLKSAGKLGVKTKEGWYKYD